MISVSEALRLIFEHAPAPEAEQLPIGEAVGRRASSDVIARVTNLPFRASAMDGYAMRFADMKKDAKLNVIGEAPAGAPFDGAVGECESVRIFTGGIVPEGADHVVIQEDVARDGMAITIMEAQDEPGNIRPPGQDFRAGDEIIKAGNEITPLAAAFAASANIAEIEVARRPRVFFFSNGDELIEPGATAPARGQVISSTPYGLKALLQSFGAEAIYGGVARDNLESLDAMIDAAIESSADIITPLGGASVGDYDLVKPAFKKRSFEIVFEKIAVKPGKPTWFAKQNSALALGLPGNPASAFACAYLFLAPLVAKMTGYKNPAPVFHKARLLSSLRRNGGREHYLRARYHIDDDGVAYVEPFPNQDSSLLAPFASANCLIRRAPDAAAGEAGEIVEILQL